MGEASDSRELLPALAVLPGHLFWRAHARVTVALDKVLPVGVDIHAYAALLALYGGVTRSQQSVSQTIDQVSEVVATINASVDQQKWFAKGTGPEAGKTRALPEIWSKPDDFTAAQQMLSDRAPKLLAAVKAKDLPGVQAAFKEVGGACKNCHDNFRSPEDNH